MTIQNGVRTPTGSADLIFQIEPVARLLLGEPNAQLSKKNELRFGTNGSLSVNLEKDCWRSHEEEKGGGVLDLIEFQTGISTRAGQLTWLEENGLKEQEQAENPASKRKEVARYGYTDENGNLLFEVVRFEPKDFRQCRPDGKGGTIWNLKDVPQVPFHLCQMLAATDQQVFIVEGEKDVLRLESLGLVATCNAGGAGKWPDSLRDHFAGRDVVILPDNDDAGRKHAALVSSKLQGIAASIRVLALPGLPVKGDASDWIDSGGTTEQLLQLVEKAEPAQVHEEHFEPGDDDDDKQSQASLLVKFVEQRFELFHDQNKDVFAKDRKTGEVRFLDSRQFKDCLQAGFYMETGKSPRDQSVREAIGTLSGLGRFNGECLTVSLRTAGAASRYFLDLARPGYSRAVLIQQGSWEVVDAPEAMFVRPESMQPLPVPERGGSISTLWKIANIPEGSRLLALAWLVECLRPDTPFPVLELLGEQGSGKSGTQTALRRVIDPNACDLRGSPKSVEDVFVSAGACCIVSYENVSHLPPPMQDALCTIATGGGHAKRKQYTNSEESIISVKRPIILNGISACVTAQDLVDRTITIETPVITDRLEVTELWRDFETELPKLLGALLDIAAKALELLPTMRIPADQRPRLVEFARLGMAVAAAAGHKPEDFMREFNACRQESLSRTIDASPVAAAVVDYIENHAAGIEAPAKVILATLEQYRPAGCESWPRSPKGLGDALRRAAPALRQIGIECKCLGKGSGGVVRWEIKNKVVVSKSQMSQVPKPELEKLGHGTSGTSSPEVSFDESDMEAF
jgi:hypothetical protein